jgi:hypothetical protein
MQPSALPARQCPIDARVVNLGTAFGVHPDRQRFPLAAGVKQLQDVIENRVQRQRWSRPTPAPAQMWQDKLLKLIKVRTRWNRLPVVTSGHPSHPQIWTLADPGVQSVRSNLNAARRQS